MGGHSRQVLLDAPRLRSSARIAIRALAFPAGPGPQPQDLPLTAAVDTPLPARPSRSVTDEPLRQGNRASIPDHRLTHDLSGSPCANRRQCVRLSLSRTVALGDGLAGRTRATRTGQQRRCR